MVFGRAVAQEELLVSERYPELRYGMVLGDVYFTSYIQIKGDAFLTEDWVSGDIYLKNGRTIANVKFKLDAYAHRLLVYQEYIRRVVILDKSLIAGFDQNSSAGMKKFILDEKSNTRAKTSDGSFLEVLSEGIISLYKLYYRDVLPLRANEGIFLDEFIEETAYYIYEKGNYNFARLNKSTLLNLYPQFKVELKHFIRKERLHVKRESDFVMAIHYLSELVEPADK
jgi:hypothetical protein